MDEVIKSVARALFEQDTGATRADISWGNASSAVHINYESKARSVLWGAMFKEEFLYTFLEKQL